MIEKLSHEIQYFLKKHQLKTPINVWNIANELGLDVYLTESPKYKSFSGNIVKDLTFGGKSGYAIFINKEHNSNRQRFTIAHEIAHFLLHKDLIGNGITDNALYRSGLSSKVEIEANALAAEILIPIDLLEEALRNDIQTIEELAKVFRVSESCMSIRLGIPC